MGPDPQALQWYFDARMQDRIIAGGRPAYFEDDLPKRDQPISQRLGPKPSAQAHQQSQCQ